MVCMSVTRVCSSLNLTISELITKITKFLIPEKKAYIVALCQDEMIRIWTHDGQLKLESEFAQADQRNNSDEPIFGLELIESDEQTEIYIQIGNVIYRGTIELGDSIKMNFIGSVSIVNQSLISFCVVNDTIWAACQEQRLKL